MAAGPPFQAIVKTLLGNFRSSWVASFNPMTYSPLSISQPIGHIDRRGVVCKLNADNVFMNTLLLFEGSLMSLG